MGRKHKFFWDVYSLHLSKVVQTRLTLMHVKSKDFPVWSEPTEEPPLQKLLNIQLEHCSSLSIGDAAHAEARDRGKLLEWEQWLQNQITEKWKEVFWSDDSRCRFFCLSLWWLAWCGCGLRERDGPWREVATVWSSGQSSSGKFWALGVHVDVWHVTPT